MGLPDHPDSMRAWLCETTTGVGDLRFVDRPTPTPGPGQALVGIRAASLNFPDLLIVENKYQFKPPLPFVPGSEFAGVVEAVGPGVATVKPGDHVASVAGVGGFATHAVVEASQLIGLPPAMPFEDAAAFVLTYGTTHHALVDRAVLVPGETVLILGAAGGVGTAAIQVAKHLGARVIAAVSSDEKADLCETLGADLTVNYSRDNLRDAIKSATDGRGPNVVYDPVGGPMAEAAFRSIAWRGRYLVIGFAGGIPSLPLNLALLKGASIVGVFWGEYVRREPAAFARSVAELSAWYAAGAVKPVLDRVLPMAELPAAYHRMASREARGKIVMVNPA
jgi:NADPH2:quinone reductase